MNVSLLIAEDRTHFTKSMLARRRPANEVVVLSQHSGESRRDFHEPVTELFAGDDMRILLDTGASEGPEAWMPLRALVDTVVAFATPVARHIEWLDAGSATAWGNA